MVERLVLRTVILAPASGVDATRSVTVPAIVPCCCCDRTVPVPSTSSAPASATPRLTVQIVNRIVAFLTLGGFTPRENNIGVPSPPVQERPAIDAVAPRRISYTLHRP